MAAPFFSKNTPNKIGNGIEVSGRNTLIKTNDGWRAAIADESFDTRVNGKKMFCVRVDNAGMHRQMMVGFTPMETFDSNKSAHFGDNGFTGCGMFLRNGFLLHHPVSKFRNIMDDKISKKAKEIIVILTISNNGKKKEIRFLCDGKESQSSDVSEYLKEDFLFPAICLSDENDQVATISIDEIKTRTPEIEKLINENPGLRFSLNALRQNLELQRVLLQQAEVQIRAVIAKMKFETKM
jgi:hypothetical protein